MRLALPDSFGAWADPTGDECGLGVVDDGFGGRVDGECSEAGGVAGDGFADFLIGGCSECQIHAGGDCGFAARGHELGGHASGFVIGAAADGSFAVGESTRPLGQRRVQLMRRQTPWNCLPVSAAEAAAARTPTRDRLFMVADTISTGLGGREGAIENEEFLAELCGFPAEGVAFHEQHASPGADQGDGNNPIRGRREIPTGGAEEDAWAGDSDAEGHEVVGEQEALAEIVTVGDQRVL